MTALAAQSSPPTFEVIIAEDGAYGTDVTGHPQHPECTGIRVLSLGTRRGVSAARNLAIANANGALLAFLDDDALPSPAWLATLAGQLGKHDAVTGRIIERAPGVLGSLRTLAFDHRHRTNLARGNPVDYVSGGNFGVRAEALHAVGPFNVNYVKSQDRELARRLVEAGFFVTYAPDLVIEHRGHYTVASLVRGGSGRAGPPKQ